MRVIVATDPATQTPAPIGVTRDGVVYELFFTALPQVAFTAADVVGLYLHRGAFETVLCDEDKEQDSDRWVSHTPCGQEFWQILAQWMWNVRLELGHRLHPTALRTTEFAEAGASPLPPPVPDPPASVIYGPPERARAARVGIFAGTDFTAQPDGTLRCPAGHPLYPQERRAEQDGTVRVVYTARRADCRGCPLREQCLLHGKDSKNPRRVSAVLRPIGTRPSSALSPPPSASHPILWGDWSRCQTRRELVRLLRTQTVIMTVTPSLSPPEDVSLPLTRSERAHWRMSWAQRLARNAASPLTPSVQIHLFGIPTAFATTVGLAAA
jgi:Transposase DDE domain